MTSRATPSSVPDAALERGGRSSLAPGQLLGEKYRIEARIAEGGMGVVLRATHLELDCPVAIKLIRPEHSQNEDVVARLLTEARIAAGLRSKHVNRVLDVGRTESGAPYLVLEHLEGSDLASYLERRGKLPISEAVDWILQCCEALAEAHAFGIVHRDLKPDNLFLSEEADGSFVLKVLDFGISKAPASRRGGRTLTNPFEVVGSPTYMSPEQIRGGNVDARADIWALGTVLHELVSGDVPFAAATVTDTFSQILSKQHALAPLDAAPGSAELEAIIRKCTQREAEQRYRDVVELAAALAPLGTDPLQARRVAKVAVASHARLIASSDTGALASLGTPLALSAPKNELTLDVEPVRPRLGRWLRLAGAAAALAIAGVTLWRLGSQHGAPPIGAAAVAPVPSPQPPRSPEPAPLPVNVDVIPALGGPPLASASATKAQLPQPSRPQRSSALFAGGKPATKASVVVTAEAAAPPPSSASVVTASADLSAPPKAAPPELDAWDTKAFGGRR